MVKENRKRKRKEKWEKGKERGGGRVSARRRRLRGARARGGVRGMAVIIAVGEKEKVESTNGIGSWESGVRDREKIFGS